MKRSVCIAFFLFLTGCNEGGFNTTHPGQTYSPSSPKPTPDFYKNEVAVVRRSKFKKQRLLNLKEEELFWKLVKLCNEKSLRVFPQVSLGEMLSAEDNEAYRRINSKRVDFCITDKKFLPIAVVEYHGSGHKNETSDERDKVKKVAVEMAGIEYIAISDGQEYQVNKYLSEALNSRSERVH